MIRRVLFIGVLAVLTVALIGCASAPAAPTAAPQTNQPTSAAPVSSNPLTSLPPQPTIPPPAPGAPYTWQTAVPALIVAGPTLAPTSAPTAAPTSAATKAPAAAQPTTAATAAPVATAPGVATGKKTDVKFSFTTPLATIEDAQPLDEAMKKLPGIFESASGQTSTTVTYDAGLITVDQIMQAFALQGHPVKPQ